VTLIVAPALAPVCVPVIVSTVRLSGPSSRSSRHPSGPSSALTCRYRFQGCPDSVRNEQNPDTLGRVSDADEQNRPCARRRRWATLELLRTFGWPWMSDDVWPLVCKRGHTWTSSSPADTPLLWLARLSMLHERTHGDGGGACNGS
jgi:hypothetical protein